MPEAYSESVVIFLDVLGTRERDTFEKRYAVHQVFHTEARVHEARHRKLRQPIYERTVRSFSDCAFFIYRYKADIEEGRKDHNQLLYTALGNIATSVVRFLDAGFIVRGGVAFGECYYDELGSFGPAMDCAYHIESKVAKYPRVVIEDAFGNQLYEWQEAQELHPAMEAVFTEKPRLLLKDPDDGKIFLNLFNALEQSQYLRFPDKEFEYESFKIQILTDLASKLEVATEPSVKEKLEWLIAFTSRSESKLRDGAAPIGTFVIGD